MPSYNPATGGENVPLGYSPSAQDYAFPQLGPVTTDGAGIKSGPELIVNNLFTGAMINAAAVTVGQTGADQTNNSGRGLAVFFNMANAGTGSVTVTIQGKDPTSGQYYTLLAGAAVIANSFNVYRVYPGLTAAANAVASDILPTTWRVITTANNANATTYTVSAAVIE